MNFSNGFDDVGRGRHGVGEEEDEEGNGGENNFAL